MPSQRASVTSNSRSASHSNPEAGSGSSASACVAHPSFASLQAQDIQPLIEESEWYDNDESESFTRTVSRQYNFENGRNSEPRFWKRPSSESMSMAATAQTHSTATFGSAAPPSYAPSLVFSDSTLSTQQSIRTKRTDSFTQYHVLDAEEDGTFGDPEPRGSRILKCSLWFLACDQTFDNLEEWNMHCQAHFRNKLPRVLHCPFPCVWQTRAETGNDAWQEQKDHIEYQHRDAGAMVDTDRAPEPSLLQHLWQFKIISDMQFKELRANGRLREEGPSVMRPAGSVRDRRRERERRTGPTR